MLNIEQIKHKKSTAESYILSILLKLQADTGCNIESLDMDTIRAQDLTNYTDKYMVSNICIKLCL